MEAFLTMRGIKTFPLRLERQCENAKALAAWLRTHPRVERVYYPDDPAHPDARIIERLLAPGLRGAMVAFEIRGAGKSDVFSFLNGLRLIVKATSLGDLHSIVLYPWISSHRDVPVELKERMGVRENLVRVSVGIEHIGDIQADLENALS
jgi:cystathionine gamma-synthase/methionine-gamma-lyase